MGKNCLDKLRMTFQTINGKLFYRVGDVIMTTNKENPAKWYGGTWEIFAPGRTVVCIDTSQSEFNSVKKVGGEKSHVLTINEIPSHSHMQNAHLHTASSQSAGSHGHRIRQRNNVFGQGNNDANYSLGYHTDAPDKNPSWVSSSIEHAGEHTHTISVNATVGTNQTTGVSISDNILQPFITVYMWIRVT